MKTIILTKRQAWIVEAIRMGLGEESIIAHGAANGSSSYHSQKCALRRKGCISVGKQGKRGSVKVLVAPPSEGGYVIDPNSDDFEPLDPPRPTRSRRRRQLIIDMEHKLATQSFPDPHRAIMLDILEGMKRRRKRKRKQHAQA